jgi:hypothetical protein
MDRTIIAALFATAAALTAACSDGPAKATYTLWEIVEVYPPGKVFADHAETTRIEQGLDRTACELVLRRKQEYADQIRTSSERWTKYACVASGKQPETEGPIR